MAELTAPTVTDEVAVIRRLSTLDRFLPLWIATAMASGLGLGSLVPGLNTALNALQVGSVSVPIALGLLLMMYPVLTKVRYEDMGKMRGDGRMFGVSLFLANEPAYRTGVIVVGLARCIAMVLVWNDLAGGDRDRAAVLVIFNAIFQVAAYALLGWFYLNELPHLLGLNTQGFTISIWEVARTTLIFLGIPLTAGYATRRWGLRTHGRVWFEAKVIPRIAPLTLYGLLFTIVVLFAIQGHHITAAPLTVARIALPLLCYFASMWTLGFLVGKAMKLGYEKTATLAFTVAGNDFELAIAVAVGVWGATSGQALAGVVGPLIEVPVLVTLVYVALWLRRRWWPPEPQLADAAPVKTVPVAHIPAPTVTA
jgi:ACR3 family arsenite transporter